MRGFVTTKFRTFCCSAKNYEAYLNLGKRWRFMRSEITWVYFFFLWENILLGYFCVKLVNNQSTMELLCCLFCWSCVMWANKYFSFFIHYSDLNYGREHNVSQSLIKFYEILVDHLHFLRIHITFPSWSLRT